MQSHAKSFARIESNWTIREDVSSLISNISCTKQSNLFIIFIQSFILTCCVKEPKNWFKISVIANNKCNLLFGAQLRECDYYLSLFYFHIQFVAVIWIKRFLGQYRQ